MPEIGHERLSDPRGDDMLAAMREEVPDELLLHVTRTTGLPPSIAGRLIADVMGYFVETAEEYVRRRHAELRARRKSNAEIWPLISTELALRPVAAQRLSERQLRRIVYG
jgi:hypothetical protein